MTVGEALAAAVAALEQAGLESPRQDAVALMGVALDCDRARIVAASRDALTAADRKTFEALLSRRLAHEPIQYLRGSQEFYGRRFRVNPAVLVPRPETELLVETVLARLSQLSTSEPRVLEIGTGSGCIAATLLAERPELRVVATDISSEALAVAAVNALDLGCRDRLKLVPSDLFEALPRERFDVIVSNPPYVGTKEMTRVDLSVRSWEPAEAVFAGDSGLEIMAPLLAGAARFLAPSGALVLEFGQGQRRRLTALAEAHGWRADQILADLAGIDRCAVFERE